MGKSESGSWVNLCLSGYVIQRQSMTSASKTFYIITSAFSIHAFPQYSISRIKSTLSNQPLMSSLMAIKHKLFPKTQLWSQYLKDIQTAITLHTFSRRPQKDIQTSTPIPGPFLNPAMRQLWMSSPRLAPTHRPSDFTPSCLTAHWIYALTAQSTFKSLPSTSNGCFLASTSFATP